MGRPIKTAKTQTTGIVDSGFSSATSGVVGGATGQAGTQVLARVKIGAQTEANGYIIRQKGKSKFLVASTTAIQDEDIKSGNTYVITNTSNTDWTYFGVRSAANGTVFTATVDGTSLTTNGVVNQVTVCTLANIANASLTNNTMTVECTYANSTTFKAKTLSNHHVTDFNDPAAVNVKYIADFSTANASTTPYPTVTVANA
jgi:hypothetical protein